MVEILTSVDEHKLSIAKYPRYDSGPLPFRLLDVLCLLNMDGPAGMLSLRPES